MNIFVIGSGGREHALIKALSSSHQVFGSRDGFGVEVISPQKNLSSLIPLLKEKQIELVVIGPEKELTMGWGDTLRQNGFLVFGPNSLIAQLEGSKIFAKEFMKEAQVPMARYQVVGSVSSVLEHAKQFFPPFVLKVSGLAGGKGVFICKDLNELKKSAQKVFDEKIFGEQDALLEEHQTGEELSVFILTNGKDYQVLPLAQDHKRLFNHQQGPNTGGMGAVAPIEVDSKIMERIHRHILQPTVRNLKGWNYLGVLYVGIMITPQGPCVLEYNVRFGDPECQVLLPLIEEDLGEVFKQIALGNLPSIHFKKEHSCCIVLSEKGYPENPQKGLSLNLNSIQELTDKDLYLLHAGTRKENQNFIVNGGRVLNVVAVDVQKNKALKKAHVLAEKIKQQNPTLHYRTDIGK